MPQDLAKYIPLNPVEHDNMLRTIIVSHMGTTDGNPTAWVVKAVHEAFQRGFGLGFKTGGMQRVAKPRSEEDGVDLQDHPAYQVQLPSSEQAGFDADRKRIGGTKALPMVERVSDAVELPYTSEISFNEGESNG